MRNSITEQDLAKYEAISSSALVHKRMVTSPYPDILQHSKVSILIATIALIITVSFPTTVSKYASAID
jgi:hypothetical protein